MTDQASRGAAEYLLVESRTGHTSDRFLGDALALTRSGADVRVLLVSDAVVAASGRPCAAALVEFLARGGRLWVDAFTLAQRAIAPARLVEGAAVVDMDEVAKTLADEHLRVVWH